MNFYVHNAFDNIHKGHARIRIRLGDDKGFSFIMVLTPCAIFNEPGLFNTIMEKASYLREGELVELPASLKEKPWLHDPSDIGLALRLAQSPVLEKPHLGVFFKGKGKGNDVG